MLRHYLQQASDYGSAIATVCLRSLTQGQVLLDAIIPFAKLGDLQALCYVSATLATTRGQLTFSSIRELYGRVQGASSALEALFLIAMSSNLSTPADADVVESILRDLVESEPALPHSVLLYFARVAYSGAPALSIATQISSGAAAIINHLLPQEFVVYNDCFAPFTQRLVAGSEKPAAAPSIATQSSTSATLMPHNVESSATFLPGGGSTPRRWFQAVTTTVLARRSFLCTSFFHTVVRYL